MTRRGAGGTAVGSVFVAAWCLGGCASTTVAARATPAATVSAPAAVSAPADCPAPPATSANWPSAIPASLRKPPGAVITRTTVMGSATYVYFTSPVSLRQGTLFAVTSLRAAGYTVARGDSEATESDAPFANPMIVGAMRLTRTAACLTTWVLAVVPRDGPPPPLPSLVPYVPPTAGATPAAGATATAATPQATPGLIGYTPGPRASPLPFG